MVLSGGSRWRSFLAASFLLVTFMLLGLPWLPTMAGIVLAGVWNAYAEMRSKRTLTVAQRK